jgi:Tol biopolymer transport system component
MNSRSDISRSRLLVLGALVLLAVCLLSRPAQAAFPGLNGKIAMEREFLIQTDSPTPRGQALRPGDELWTMNPDGSGQVNIASESGFDFERPAWSADGKHIAIRKQDAHDTPDTSQIWTMLADGSSLTNISNSSTFDTDPAWSPDGSTIVFTRRDDTTGLFSLWVMGADGSNPHQLLTPPSGADDRNPAWSPDGTTIAFDRFTDPTGPGQIWLVGADGSNPRNISNDSDDDQHPNWSPDGHTIAFDKTINADFDTNGNGIWVMGADGSGQHQLIPNVPGFGTGSYSDTRPAFSPDGKLISFQRENDDESSPLFPQAAIMVAGADGSNPHNVSNPNSSQTDVKPDWQPLASVSSSAQAAACIASGKLTVHVSDAAGNKSGPKAVHFKVDGGAEQVAPTTPAGDATVTLPNGKHTVEYWGENQAGDQEAQHHTATLAADTTHKCAPAVSVAGVRRACVSRSPLNVRVHVTSPVGLKSVTVSLDGKRLRRSSSGRFTLKIKMSGLKAGRHKLRIVTVDKAGKKVTTTRTIARCAVAKPRRRAAPRFTG